MLYYASVSKLRVKFTGGGFFTIYDYKELDRTKWTRVEISQKKEGSSSMYRYSVKVDNDEKHFKINDKAKEFFDVKVYVSNPSRSAAEGSIRNIFINPGGKTIDPFTVKVTQYLRGHVFEFRRVRK